LVVLLVLLLIMLLLLLLMVSLLLLLILWVIEPHVVHPTSFMGSIRGSRTHSVSSTPVMASAIFSIAHSISI